MGRKSDNSVDVRQSPVEVYINTSMKTGEIYKSGGDDDETLSSVEFMVLAEYMTLKGKLDDVRVYSNFCHMKAKPKVYNLRGRPGYDDLNWSTMTKDEKQRLRKETGASHCTILIVNVGGKMGQLTLKGSTSMQYFNFKKKLSEAGLGDPSAEDIMVNMKNGGEEVSHSHGSSRVPTFSYKDAGSDDCEITEDLYEKQKAHFSALSGVAVEEKVERQEVESSGEPDNAEPINIEKPNAKHLMIASEDLSYCQTAEDIQRDYSRFFGAKYNEYDKATVAAIHKMWQEKYTLKNGKGELIPI